MVKCRHEKLHWECINPKGIVFDPECESYYLEESVDEKGAVIQELDNPCLIVECLDEWGEDDFHCKCVSLDIDALAFSNIYGQQIDSIFENLSNG